MCWMKKAIFFMLPVCVVLLTTGSTPVWTGYADISPRVESVAGNPSVTMVFAGDIMAHDVNLNRRPYRRIYAGIEDILGAADLRFANIEFVVDPSAPVSGYPKFNASPRYLGAALDAGFNVLSLANNHSFDIGAASMLQTLRTVTVLGITREIYYNGIQFRAEEKLTPTIIQRNGCKIGFLAVTSFLNKLVIDERVNVVPFYRQKAEEALIDRIRGLSKDVDIFVLSYHGGIEYSKTSPEWKKRFFQKLIGAGVDILWSHHPHVVQAWQTIELRDTSKLILYSTGNLISGQTWNIDPINPTQERIGTGEGAFFFVDFTHKDGYWQMDRVHAVPIVNYQDPGYGMVVLPFKALSSMEIAGKWQLYYSHRYEKLKGVLVDIGSWGFEP